MDKAYGFIAVNNLVVIAIVSIFIVNEQINLISIFLVQYNIKAYTKRILTANPACNLT